MSDWGLSDFAIGDGEAKTFGPAFTTELKQRMNAALDRCTKEEKITRAEVAYRMSQFLGVKIGESMINQYVAQSAGDKQMNISRFIAFVYATKAFELLGILVAPFEMRVVTAKNAKLVERELLKERLKALESDIESADQQYRGVL